jgi:hypothetical protein
VEIALLTPKRKASGSNPLRNARENSQTLRLKGVWLFFIILEISLRFICYDGKIPGKGSQNMKPTFHARDIGRQTGTGIS